MECSAPSQSTKSSLRLKFENCLEGWNREELDRLVWLLQIWGWANDDTKTMWELIEERLNQLAEQKNLFAKGRPRDPWEKNVQQKEVETPETIIEWLFKAPVADEWIRRFRCGF